jgi:hypothetical protein
MALTDEQGSVAIPGCGRSPGDPAQLARSSANTGKKRIGTGLNIEERTVIIGNQRNGFVISGPSAGSVSRKSQAGLPAPLH